MAADDSESVRYRELRDAANEGLPGLTVLLARRFLVDFPDHGPAWMSLGMKLVDLARYEEAEQALRKTLAVWPLGRHVALDEMGRRFEQQGQYDRATEWYQQAIDARPCYITAHIDLGGILARQGRLREAESVYRSATLFGKGSLKEAHLNLGFMLRAQEQFADAAECFRETIRLDPHHRVATKALRDVERCLRFVNGNDECENQIADDWSMKGQWTRVREAIDAGHSAMAVLLLKRFLNDFPDFCFGWYFLSSEFINIHRYDEAEEALTQAIAFASEESRRNLLGQMGHLFREQGNYDRAAHWYREAIDAAPHNASAYVYLGALFAVQGRLTDAETIHRKAITCSDGCIDEAYYNLGLILRAQERFVEAGDCFREALRLTPNDRIAKQALRDAERCLRFADLEDQ
jgi:tetratricopeptide (TPR) repeat protein